jgi:hypothetical protein
MRETAVEVMMASPIPMMAWIPAMAGKATFKGEVPEIANSIAAAEAPITMESQDEMAKAMKKPLRLFWNNV